MTTGHSFLPCDRDFALIEKAKKGKHIYVPFQWVEIIAHANSNHPFTVCLMNTKDFKNTDIVLNSLATNKFNITNHVWYQMTADDPTTLRGRTAHNVLQPWYGHVLSKIIRERDDVNTSKTSTSQKKRPSKKEVRRYPPVVVQQFPRLYEGTLPIKAAKKKDLLDMCRYIPQEYVPFYENIAWNNQYSLHE
ncbi:hypothetical protein J6590_079176 [Homalodisca vitripennis]|nr:hypothetical protein J6590_079176 [Homalodisca vitripennis]